MIICLSDTHTLKSKVGATARSNTNQVVPRLRSILRRYCAQWGSMLCAQSIAMNSVPLCPPGGAKFMSISAFPSGIRGGKEESTSAACGGAGVRGGTWRRGGGGNPGGIGRAFGAQEKILDTKPCGGGCCRKTLLLEAASWLEIGAAACCA